MGKPLSWLIDSVGLVVIVIAGAACSRSSSNIAGVATSALGSGTMSEQSVTMHEAPSVKGAVEGKEVVTGDQPNENE